MRKFALLVLLCPSMALAQVQVSGSAVQIGGNVPNVTAINGASGSFTFQGNGVSCIDTTCTFTGGVASLTTSGNSGLPSIDSGVLNIPSIHGGNVFQSPNFMSLVGAFTDSSGNVIQPIAIGNGPVTFAVPYGATLLQLGPNDTNLSDDTGSWVINVNGSPHTVLATTPPWLHTSGANALYPTAINGPSAVVSISVGAVGTPVTIQYVSGTVSSSIASPLCGGLGPVSVDADGEVGCAPDYDPLTVGGGFFPGYWTSSTPAAAISSIAWGAITGTLSAQTDLNTALGLKAPLASPALSGVPTAPTATPGTNTTQLATTAFVIANGGSGTPGGSNGNLQYNNSGAFGGDASTSDDGAGNVAVKTITTNGGAGQGGTWDATEGTPPSGAAGHDLLYADSITHQPLKNPNNTGAKVAVGTSTTAATSGHCAQYTANGYDIADAGAACGSGSGGGYTNVTGSISETTVALINTACGSGTYYATTALSIATGGTITCPVQFSKAGVWTIASGQVVTFSKQITETDAPVQHFAGSGTVVLAGQDAHVEWFGGVGDWNGSTGTDNLASFNTCIAALSVGQCIIQANKSYAVSDTVLIAKSWVGIGGTAPVTNNTGATIVSTTAGADGVAVHGTGAGARVIGNTLSHFVVSKSVLPTGTASGLSLEFTGGLVVDNVQTKDFIRGKYLEDNAAFGTGYIANGQTSNATAYTGQTLYGIYADGAGTSTRVRHETYSDLASGSRTTWGFYCNGCIDVMVDRFEAAKANHGLGFAGSIQDVSFRDSTLDSLTTDCINTNPTGSSTASIISSSIQGGECNSTGAYGADIDGGSLTFQLQGMRFLQAGTTAAIRLHSSFSTVQGNTIYMRNAAGGVGILADGSSFGHVTGNTVDNTAGSTTSLAYKFINTSVTNTFQDNIAKSSGVTSTAAAITFDATSCLNNAYNLNRVDGGSFTGGTDGVTDTCGNNSFSPSVTTNLAGGGVGSAPYQSAASTTAFIASPTTSAHTFLYSWQPSGSAIAPAAWDFGANVGTYVKATSPIVATQNANDVTLSCPTCGTSSATNVTVNGGAGLGTANFNDTTPAAGSNGKNVAFQVSSSNVSAEIVGDGNAAHYLDGTGAYSTPAGGGSSFTPPAMRGSTTTGAVSGASVSSATTPAATYTAGDLIIAFFRSNSTGRSCTFTSSPSATWHALTAQNGSQSVQMGWSIAAGGSTTVTCTISGGADTNVALLALDYTNTGSTINTSVSGTSTAATSTALTLTTTQRTLDVFCTGVTSNAQAFSGLVAGGNVGQFRGTDSAAGMGTNGGTATVACWDSVSPFAATTIPGNGTYGTSVTWASTYAAFNY